MPAGERVMTGAANPSRSPGFGRMPGIVRLLALLPFLASSPARAQEPLSIRLIQSDTAWIVTEATTLDLLVTAAPEGDGLVLDSLRLDLPADLRCGSRDPLPIHRFDGGILGPGSTVRAAFTVPEASGSCTRLLDELGRSSAGGEVWFDDLASERSASQRFNVTIAWRAGALVILLGALVGAIASALFRFVAGKAGHKEAFFPEGHSPGWGLALNVMTVVIVVALIRLLPDSQLPGPFRALVADTFGSGFLLGLISNSLVLPLLNLVLKGEGVLPQPGDGKPTNPSEEKTAIEV